MIDSSGSLESHMSESWLLSQLMTVWCGAFAPPNSGDRLCQTTPHPTSCSSQLRIHESHGLATLITRRRIHGRGYQDWY